MLDKRGDYGIINTNPRSCYDRIETSDTVIDNTGLNGFGFACHFSEGGWKELIDNTDEGLGIIWTNPDELNGQLQASIDKTTLPLYETAQIDAKIDPLVSYTLDYYSSDDKIARVSDAGTVTAVSPGKTTVFVKTENGSQSASFDITVTDSPIPLPDLELPDHICVKADDERFEFNGGRYKDCYAQYASERAGGIFIYHPRRYRSKYG